MKRPFCWVRFLGTAIVAWVSAAGSVSAQAIIAGLDPVTDTGVTDGWTNILYVNESHPFNFTGTGQTQGTAFQFRFWADGGTGTVTPFVAEVTAADAFIVRAIGTTRRGGLDWIDPGLQTFAFKDGETPIVQHGWVAGFISSTAEGDEGGSPIPFATSNVEGWLTGTSTMGSGLPNIVEGQAPTLGATGTDPGAYGRRQYAFQIAAALTAPLAPTDITATPMILRAGLTAGATAATLAAVDGNALDTHTFTLVAGVGATDNAKFTITGNQLQAAVALGGDGTTYSIRIRGRDSTNLTFEKSLVLSVLGDKPPTAVHVVPAVILSALPIGSSFALLSSDDPNNPQGDIHDYELVTGEGSSDNGSFSLEDDRLILQTQAELGRTYRIRIRSKDSTGLTREESFALPVIQAVGNELSGRSDPTDQSVVPIFYTTGVEMPGTGTVDAVTIPVQSEGQFNLVFRMFQLRPTANPDEPTVVADSGPITVAGAVGGLATFPFPNGAMAVQAGDLFFHYGRGIPFSANQGNFRPIWWPCPNLPAFGQPLNLALGNPDFPLREDLQRDYSWAVHFTPGPAIDLRIVAVSLDSATKMVTLTWTSQPNHTYRIKASTALVSWLTDVAGAIPGAAGPTTSSTFGPVTVPGTTFYRVEESP